MTGRCIVCNNLIVIDEKDKKKIPLLNPKCSCGGAVEFMTGNGCLKGEHPHFEQKTFRTDSGDPYYYAYKNSKGEFYVYFMDKLLLIQNPVTFTKPPKT